MPVVTATIKIYDEDDVDLRNDKLDPDYEVYGCFKYDKSEEDGNVDFMKMGWDRLCLRLYEDIKENKNEI